MVTRTRYFSAVFAIGASWVTGCAGTVPTCKVPTSVELEIETSDRLNPDDQGRSLPTDVRLYQLENPNQIEHATFEDVWSKPKQTLEGTLVNQRELTLFPGQIVVVHTERDPSAEYLAAVAIFRNPAGQSWRTLQEWPLPGDPCAAHSDEHVAPTLEQLRIRVFLRDYRIESVNNYVALPKRSCPAGESTCSGASGAAPDELSGPQQHRRLRTFEEDQSAPQPTIGAVDQRTTR
jgi:type VI secretion system protein VasD